MQLINDSSTDNFTSTEYVQTMLSSINKDLQNLNNSKSINNGDAQTVIQNSISILQQILDD